MKAARLGAMMRALATTRSRTMSAAVAPPRSRAPATTAASAASTPARRPLAPPPHASTGSYGATPPLDVVTWDKDTANQVQLIGNVGGVDFKLLPNGTPVSTVRLAVRKPRREDAQSEADADTNWFTVEAFDALAQQINEHVKVGAQVAVTGRLRQDQWQDKATGQQRNKVVVRAAKVAAVARASTSAGRMEQDTMMHQGMTETSMPRLEVEQFQAPPFQAPPAAAYELPSNPSSSPPVDEVEEMWKDLYNNPGSWYDNRADVVGTNRPDFKHKQSGKGLWLSNKNNPAWVTQWLGTRGGVADKPRAAPSRSPAAAQVAYDSPMSAPGPTKAPF